MALKGPAQFAYHLVHAAQRAEEPLIKAFRRWVLEEVARTGVADNAGLDALTARRNARRRRRAASG
jgi:hypothetical protein